MIILLTILQWAILIKVLISWLPMAGIQIDPYNPFMRALSSITDPILDPLRKYTTVGMMDLSPLVAFIAISVLTQALTMI